MRRIFPRPVQPIATASTEPHLTRPESGPEAPATQIRVEGPVTFEWFARTYIAAQEAGWKSKKHSKQWTSTLEEYAFPVIGPLHPRDIRLEHTVRILKPIWTTKTETATRVRGRKDHIVPLSEASIELYESLPRVDECNLLFPAPEGGEMSNATRCGVIGDMHEADLKRGGIGYLDPVQNRVATQHGFRSTFRDWAAEVAYIPKDVIEHALAHKLKDEAEAAYQRGTLLVKRATLMEQWAVYCNAPNPTLPSLESAADQVAA